MAISATPSTRAAAIIMFIRKSPEASGFPVLHRLQNHREAVFRQDEEHDSEGDDHPEQQPRIRS